MIELSINEVSEVVGVSQSQLWKNFKRYIPKLEKYNITYDGRGRYRKFYQTENNISDEEVAYNIFKQIAYNVWGFNRQIDIDKLLYYICILLYLQELKTEDSFCSNKAIATRLGLNKNTLNKYKNRLIKNDILLPFYLEPYITIASFVYREFPRYVSKLELIYSCVADDPDEDIHKYKHTLKIDREDIIIQNEQQNIIVDNSIWKSYLNSNRYKDIFYSQMGLTEIKAINKAQFNPTFMKDDVLLDIIFKSFLYKFSHEEKIISVLKKYNIIYIQDDESVGMTKKVS